ncbi:proton-conducting transporter membrane subunit, partial [Ectothiorhodospira haloalkaliphila]
MIEMPAIDWLTAVVFAPLAGAILAFLLPRQAHWVGVGAVVLTALMASALVLQVLTEGAVVTPLGNWGAPLGIDLRADGLSATLMAMTTGVGLLVSLGALNSYAHHRAPERMRRYFWPLWLLLLSGLNGVYLSTDLFNLYVMLEVISLAAVGLTVLSGRIEAVRAGLEYMYASILGALLFLLGVGFVYLELGRLDFAGLLAAPPSPALGAALALMVA